MSTRDEEAGTDDATRTAARRGIVRSGASLWAPVTAGGLVLAAHAATVPMDAWLPVTLGDMPVGRALVTPLSAAASWLVSMQVAVAGALVTLPWPARLGWTALLTTALAASLLTVGFRRVGLPGPAAVLLALIGMNGPVLWTQATTPMGTAPVTLASAAVILFVPPRTGAGSSWRVAVAILVGGLVTWLATGRANTGTVAVLEELGGVGLVLALLGLLAGRRGIADGYWTIAAVGAGVWGLASALGPVAQVAAAAPFVWTLVAGGLLTLAAWRGARTVPRTTVWLTLGLLAWTGLQAGARSWDAREEMTRLVRQWAQAAAAVAREAPLVTDGTPAGRLVEAWSRGTPAFETRVAVDALGEGPTRPRGPLTLLPALTDAGRWMGLTPAPAPLALASLVNVTAALPRDAVVVVALSRDAVTRLRSDAWQALAVLGSRLGPGGTPRARALVGVTGTRSAGTEAAASPATSLLLLPGDLIGQTGRPSPLDLRLEADAQYVRLFERDRLRTAAPGVVVAVYRRTGTRLALWSGPDADTLNAGVPGTDAPVVGRAGQVLPCRDLPGQTVADVTELAADGALGVQTATATRVRVSTTWPDGHPAAAPRMVGDMAGPAPHGGTDLDVRIAHDGPFGINLRGRPATVRWEADAPARVCQAPPLQPSMDVEAEASVEVHPRVETAFGSGWHDAEPMGGGRYFRWMSGPRAVLLLARSSAAGDASGPLVLSLDAQNVGTPSASDRLRLSFNGTWLEPQPLVAGRASYTWTVPAPQIREGLNVVLLETTLTLRPSDVQDGADGRLLGAALYGWRIGPVNR